MEYPRAMRRLLIVASILAHSNIALAGGNCPIHCPTAASADVALTDEGYLISGEWVVVEGDIIVGRAEDWDGISAVRGIVDTRPALRWPGGFVNYVIDPLVDQGLRNNINAAITAVENDTQIRFIQSTAGNHIRFEANPNPAAGVCLSALGMTGGEQSIVLVDGCTTGTVIHEIGHALGSYHEQSRSDRDDFITINEANICPQFAAQFDVVTVNAQDVGAYDYGSIMHYDRCAFSVNGQETITAPQPIGQRTALSQGDINTIAFMYGDDTDDDGDGVVASADNCLTVSNPDQQDTDRDSFGNACDADFNNDGSVNATDLGVMRYAFFSQPGDGNWHQNVDLVIDDRINALDLGSMRLLFLQPPGPSGRAPMDAACATGIGFDICDWEPAVSPTVTDPDAGLVSLTILGVLGDDRHIEEVQWRLNGGAWQTGNVQLVAPDGPGTFCAPGPGVYEFRAWGGGFVFFPPKQIDIPCDTMCGVSSASVVIPGPLQPTCSASGAAAWPAAAVDRAARADD